MANQISSYLAEVPENTAMPPIKSLGKYEQRKQSGSQSRIPLINKGSDYDRMSSYSDRGRESSLTNYHGKIPKVSSIEKFPMIDSKNEPINMHSQKLQLLRKSIASKHEDEKVNSRQTHGQMSLNMIKKPRSNMNV